MSDITLEIISKINNLESNMEYQEDAIEALNSTVGQQHQEIQQLQKKILLLSEYIKSLKDHNNSGIKRPEEEVPPPHY